MLKSLIVTLSLASLSGCALNDKQDPPQDLYQRPSAIGLLLLTDNQNNTYQCQATLIKNNSILTGVHCYADANIIHAEFIIHSPHYGAIQQGVNLPSPKDRVAIKDVSIFYQDAAVLTLKENINNIDPLPIQFNELSPVNGFHYVSFPQPKGKADSVRGWRACQFNPQEASPKLWLSEDCVLPKGYSGMPLLTYESDRWVIVGMYHAYLISRDKKTGDIKKAFGAASPASSWDFDSKI